MIRCVGKVAISLIFVEKVAISLIFDRFVACLAAPLVLWVPEGLADCIALLQPVAADFKGLQRIRTDYNGLDAL